MHPIIIPPDRTKMKTRILIFAAALLCTACGRPPMRQIPGGPPVVKLPELVIDAIDPSWGKESPCTGPHTAMFDVTVKIRNAGFAPAAMPPGPWQPSWILVWSIIGGTASPYQMYAGPPPAALAPGETATRATTGASKTATTNGASRPDSRYSLKLPLCSCVSITLPAACAFQSRCQRHRKRESRHHVSGCNTSRSWPASRENFLFFES